MSADPKLAALKEVMTGSFSSATQAKMDETYYDIDLHMQPIWEDKGHYLYVEQAVASAPDEPYRQRVYQLERKGKKLLSKVYELPDPAAVVGGHDNPALFADISPDDLVEREGCTVILKQQRDGTYRGSTKKNACKSSLRGASYATSRVTVSGSFINSWDQGFDADGNQVWGATEGGYMFLKE
ncbi:hypothetical protein A3850_015760 [Lewinella sp. 4G2]|nr:hypothetical protein A3850_015760 [Lewinella sp. 4G2]